MFLKLCSIVLGFVIVFNANAGDILTDLHGNLEQYGKSKHIIVQYNNEEQSKLRCEKMGFKVIEKFGTSSWKCELKKDTTLNELILLVSYSSINSVRPEVFK
jgi:hypothetical protein